MYVSIVLAVLIHYAVGKLPPVDLSHYGTSLYRKIDPNVDKLIRNLDHSLGIQPWELGSLVESDMRLPLPKLRNGLRTNSSNSFVRWPNATLIYQIEGHFNKTELGFIFGAMREFEKYTCIRFRERTDEKAYVSIGNTDYGCWADVGRGEGKTVLNLQPGCANALVTPIHEMMHSLGFYHEHNRPDRDDYVEVRFDYMYPDPPIYFNFMVEEDSDVTNFSVPYDLGSIMHYTKYAFSAKPGKLETLAPLVPWHGDLGQRETFTKYDVLLINIMYCGTPEPTEPLPVPDRWTPAEPLMHNARPKRSTTLRKVIKRRPTSGKMTKETRERMEQQLRGECSRK
ncbi:hatching enzyme 1.2-like [Toxorhynchites rutilus septentrionalis]|uniref:hatching enzyme 1.2-like n=1 Tax=Toxorhynchites rutilus septentrionalis TaxID=329112 RepID=UPI002478DFC5|nr:hatching enzyme 1.2-like [Toxorhynchites rutilus septentrionalis]